MIKKALLLVAMCLPVIASLMLLSTPTESKAIPAWTRKYKMACTNCHFGGTNRLTKYGKDFQWKMFGTIGQEKAEDEFAFNLAEYSSFAMKVRFESDDHNTPKNKFDVEALSLYSGGPLMEGFGYFFEFYMHERGKEANSTGTGTVDTAVREKMAEAYLAYAREFTGGYWFARAGSYTPRGIHNLSTGGRIPISRAFVLNDDPGNGNMFTPRDRFYGVAAGGALDSGLKFEAGITNGGGGNKRPNQPENNGFKDLWATLEQQVDNEGSYVGLFGYNGRYPISVTAGGVTTTAEDKFTRFGLYGAFQREALALSGGYFWGRNDYPVEPVRNNKGYFIEGGYNVSPSGTAFARIDHTDWNRGVTKRGFTIGYSQRLSSVGRVVLEYNTAKLTGKDATRGLMLELNFMF